MTRQIINPPPSDDDSEVSKIDVAFVVVLFIFVILALIRVFIL